ncbi:MAG: hypothetical protein RL208_792 [Pseudomonadota bacterium]|jgi:hypothetical protein
MKKPWSITTTLRNPERLRSFLIVLKDIEGQKWNSETQKKYQTLLIQARVYGYGEKQFYNGLEQRHIDLIDNPSQDISFNEAKEIFEAKNYEDPAMRGRQSMNPLKKIGLVRLIDGKIYITDLGKLFLKDNYDLGEVFFRSFLKWQLPNPESNDYKEKDGYNIKPFLGVLHLINLVNKEAERNNEKVKGISKQEFSLFCPLLVNYNDIAKYANAIIKLRKNLQNKSKKEQKEFFENFRIQFVREFINDDEADIKIFLKNLKDYGDNAIRYFRLTRFLYIRGGGFYVDLEPRRAVEIENLLKFDNASAKIFQDKDEYLSYISDISEPRLPWESKEELIKIASSLVEDITEYEISFGISSKKQNLEHFNEDGLKSYINSLRDYRRELQEKENHRKAQETTEINEYIAILETIRKQEDKPILLEKLSSLGLNALNDAIKIKPNYPVGDDNEPTFTAPANTPDIECYYEKFNAICEVTMLEGRNQWYNEGQPVMRHLRDFEDKNKDKPSYCIFIAPTLHRDTINTFWTAIKYEYEGKKQNIIPLRIGDFINLLKILVKLKASGKFLSHDQILFLYDDIIQKSQSCSNANEWLNQVPKAIESWEQKIFTNYC